MSDVAAAAVLVAAALGSLALTKLSWGRWMAWALLPLVAGGSAGLGALVSRVWMPLNASSALGLVAFALAGCTLGAGVAMAVGAHWNMRRSWPAAVVALALSLEGAVLLALMVERQAYASGGAAWLLALLGSSLAAVGLRSGVTPQLARWSARYRGVVALSAVGSALAWWWRLELEESAAELPLQIDLWGNAAGLGAGAVLLVGLLAAVVLLGSSGRVWVRRFGAVITLSGALVLPLGAISMRWAVAESCEQHLPQQSLAERISLGLQDEIRVPQGWCRADLKASLRCPQVRTRYDLQSDRWVGQRLEQDPLDTLWGERWSRPRGPAPQAHREGDSPHLGAWMIVDGSREPDLISPALVAYLQEVWECEVRVKEPVQPLYMELEVTQDGEVRSAKLSSEHPQWVQAGPGLRAARACAQEALKTLEFPLSTCPGSQSLMLPLYLGERASVD